MKKILYMTNYPSPYRVEFFNELGKYSQLTVLFEETVEQQKHRNKDWFDTNYTNFKAVFLKGITVHGVVLSFEVLRYLKKREFDVVVIGMYSSISSQIAIQYMNLKKIKYVIETDGGYPKSGTGVKEWLKKLALSSANMYFSPSDLSDRYLEFYGAESKRIVRYPFTSLNESDISMTSVDEKEKEILKKQLGISEPFMVMTVGQFIYRKANEVLIEASKNFPKDVGVYIIGGTPTEEYQKIVDDAQLEHVHFLDFKKKRELFEYYKAADIFVLPTREDIWGLVINEAMAFGLPIISTNKCVAALELIEEGKNGYIVEVEDSIAIAEKVCTLKKDKELRQRMSQESLKKIKHYTIEKMAEVHISSFEEI